MTIQNHRMERGALVRALYNNTPDSKHELLFRKGDVLTVIEYDYEGQSGWWLCALRGQRGICPSNYLEILEDKYSLPTKNKNLQGPSSPFGVPERRLETDSIVAEAGPSSPDPELVNPLETYDFPRQASLDPIETYDFPRSVAELGKSEASSVGSGSTSGFDSASSRPVSSTPSHSSSSSSSSNPSLIHHQQQQPIYCNESVVGGGEPGKEESNDLVDSEPLYQNDTVDGGCPDPLELYDVPRIELENLDLFGKSISRLRKYGSCTGADELSSGTGHRVRFSIPDQASLTGRSQSSLGLSSTPTTTTITASGVTLRRPPRYQQRQSILSNRSSIQSESAESGIMQGDLYDVPRGTATPVKSLSNGATSSRPPSALSMSSSGMGMSIATSDSKDSLDQLYDVPRNSASLTMKTYVNHMETKYDDVLAARTRSRHDSNSSTNSFKSQGGRPNGLAAHSRHNSTSSIFSAYGYTNKRPSIMEQSAPSASTNGGAGGGMDPQDLYDVPRGSGQPVPYPRASLRCPSSNGSLNNDDDDDNLPVYDVPSQFARKVSSERPTSAVGASTSSLASSSNSNSQLFHPHPFSNSSNQFLSRSNMSLIHPPSTNHSHNHNHNHGGSTPHLNNGHGGSSSSASSRNFSLKMDEAFIKLLPLGPKAAVSVCEKLRQEVVASITAILSQVKPKWRTKKNLTEVMPDLKFSCTRLCLAIKDVADFASRSLSNAKRLPPPSDNLAPRLHRLLTPVINGSQIIQRDVDELEAYFWSVDRLSISGGDHPANNTASTSDALDQLILCSRSLKHDVNELANFLALHSTTLYKDGEHNYFPKGEESKSSSAASVVAAETTVEDTQDDYDYVSLVPTNSNGSDHPRPSSDSDRSHSVDSQKLSSAASSTSTVSWHLDSRDEQLLEFYSAQISVCAPQLSQSISTFIFAIQQNEPPSVFNVHLKYVILLGYKLLFAGDTVHRNIGNPMLKEEVELRANELHKSLLALYEGSKVATKEFPKIGPMQAIVDKVWGTTQAATQLKKCIFNAVYTSV